MRYQTKALFYRQLGVMLKAGMPILNALGTIRTTGFDAAVTLTLCDRISSGKSLTEALLHFSPRIFSPFEVAIMRAGEASGTLPDVLEKLADYFDFLHRARAKLISGLLYPAMLLHAAIIIPAVPNLISRGLGAFLGTTLPALAILYAAIFVFGVLPKKLCSLSAFGSWLDGIIINLPVVGPLVKRVVLLRFLRAFVCLYVAGIGIIRAVQIAAQTMGNSVIERETLKMVPRLEESGNISEVFALNPYFPSMLLEMLRIGEMSGKMDETLTRVINYMEHEVETGTERLVAMLPVIVYLLIAVYVGYIVISFYFRYFSQIGSLLQQ
ncbi:MAG: type II secretion system F family protein [Candidatus Omnitrophota bacterium]